MKEPTITLELKGIEFDSCQYKISVTPIEKYEQRKSELEEYLIYTKKFLNRESSGMTKDIEKRINLLKEIIYAKRGDTTIQ